MDIYLLRFNKQKTKKGQFIDRDPVGHLVILLEYRKKWKKYIMNIKKILKKWNKYSTHYILLMGYYIKNLLPFSDWEN